MALSIDLKGKTVLVTGGISGIGLGTSILFAQAGARVIVCAEQPADGVQVQYYRQQMKVYTDDAIYYQVDLTKAMEIQLFADELVQSYGKLDVVVSNAGMNVFDTVENCDQEKWDLNQHLNLESHWQVGKKMKPLLDQADQGVFIIMTSNHAYSSMKGCFPYNVAKAGLLAMVKAMAIEWAPHIRTLGIAPGFIDTPGNQKWFDSFDDADKARASTVALHPVKRLGTPEEIGAWCVFLASDYAAFANGTTYLIDGGRSALMQD